MNTKPAITAVDVQDMVSHWLKTPVNGYLGSDYGQDLKAILQTPQSIGRADEQVSKLRRDVPVLELLPPGALNLYATNTYPDKVHIVIDVAGNLVLSPEA